MIRAILLRLPIPQEETEQPEDRVRLRALRFLLFKPPVVRSPPNAKKPISCGLLDSHTSPRLNPTSLLPSQAVISE